MWQCTFIDSSGVRCKEAAVLRLHYSKDDPFNHVDICREHESKFRFYVWRQSIVRDKIIWEDESD